MEFVVTFLIAAVIICALYLLFTNGRELLFGEQPISQEKGLNLFAVLFALIGGVIFTFVLNFNFAKGYKFSESVEQWGQVGDFFGGMLNPILAFASFIALLYTIRIQSKQISEAKTGLELAAFDSTFSMMIEAIYKTPKPTRDRVGQMNAFRNQYGGDITSARLSEDYCSHYRNNEPSIIGYSIMFYDCVKFMSEHRCANRVHWSILANMLGPIECYYVASLCASNGINVIGLDCFSKLATEYKLFGQARIINGTHISLGHGDSRTDGDWISLNPTSLGLELSAFKRTVG